MRCILFSSIFNIANIFLSKSWGILCFLCCHSSLIISLRKGRA
ncbi:hypothetical protein ECHHL_0137 [Ehrlichia chaffeensis str. Heartland]|nr:hypothetical protein ECHHL_0137 [Ehrlichia chaffeensis str. Heartland]AHX05231.1 hypothetical protein ECHJAX_0139 [Ehrlichia chaffeensis str. Jax]AHX07186.1 hypothetical protein ECHOSC_0144 [Ehrlichia chaffeensis str. Osceola]AHX08277.1 hypothetical protein ECHSTV_0138 [Ehrlichia chaffeensis str. Saint Vincent]AHX09862.1 hypothetical protein ECHWAK_0139 [Ehrlichia chaffeensis str. Wakulla]